MSSFEEGPGAQPEYYPLDTWIPTITANMLKSIRDFEGHTLTGAALRLIGVHKWVEEKRAAGSLVYSVTPEQEDRPARIDPLDIPVVGLDGPELTEGDGATLAITVDSEAKAYIDRHTNDKDPRVQAAFWASAARLYSDYQERQLHDAAFWWLTPQGTARSFSFGDPFLGEQQPERRGRAVDFLRRLVGIDPPHWWLNREQRRAGES
jgi:hypothetical protein